MQIDWNHGSTLFTLSGMSYPYTHHPRLFTLGMLLALCLITTAQANQSLVDPELLQRLSAAMAEDGGFVDRFEAEVWLADMSERLRPRISNEAERLDLLRMVHAEARRADLSPEMVLAVIQVESNFDRFAISVVGARGLMQIMPFWLNELGRPDDNLFDVHTNLRFGTTILRYYLDMEKGHESRALARYNGSLGSHKYPNLVFNALRERWHQ
jgi:soluble lytic murein transglycosylase-like protein